MQFIHKVNQSIKKHNLLKFGDKVLVAVSGGADSLALLFSLNALKEIYGLRLYVAHLDHGLRRSAGKDRLFVNSIADSHRLIYGFARLIGFKGLSEVLVSIYQQPRHH